MQRAAAVTEGAVPSKGMGKREQGSEVGAEPLEFSAPHKQPGVHLKGLQAGGGEGGRVVRGPQAPGCSPSCEAFSFICLFV